MKRLLLILALLPLFASATVLKIGTTGYVNIDGQNYGRPLVQSYYQYYGTDSTLRLSLPGYGYTDLQHYNLYLDGDNGNTPFTSMAAVRTWMNANFEYVVPSGGGTVSSVTAGTGLTGGVITTTGTIGLALKTNTFDTLNLTGTTNDTVRFIPIATTGTYIFTAYCNVTTFSTAVTFKMACVDETGTNAVRTGAWRPLSNTVTFSTGPTSQAYWTCEPYPIRIQGGTTVAVLINPGAGTTLNAGFELRQID